MKMKHNSSLRKRLRGPSVALNLIFICSLFILPSLKSLAQTSKEYADTEISALETDIQAGTYDEYILSTSGGNYILSDIDLASNIVVKAKEGLAAKPMFSNAANTSTYTSFFDIEGPYSIEIDGIDFDGTATESLAGVVRVRNDNATATINNCEIYNFTTSSGIVRLLGTGTALTMDSCFVHDCYGRLIRIENNGSVIGDINITNSTFANVTDDPVIHWVTTSASTVEDITIDQCTFYNIADHVFRLGDLTGSLNVTNTIFDAVTGGITFETPGVSDVIDYSYTAGIAGSIDAAISITNSVTTAPTYTNAGSLDLTLTNQGSILGSDGTTPIGDTKWHVTGPIPVMVVNDVQSITNAAGQEALAQSNKDAGWIYIILDGEAQSNLTEMDAAVTAGKGAKSAVVAANTNVSVSTHDLTVGTYYAYAVDGSDNISTKGSNTITVLDGAVPVAVSNTAQTVSNGKDQIALVQSNKAEGTVYIVLDGEAQSTLVEIHAAIDAGKADSATVTVNDADISIPTDSLQVGTYYAYAADADGSLSTKGTNAITIEKGAPEVYADAQTVSDAADQFIQVQSSDNHGNVYIILDGEAQATVAELEAAVTAGKGSKDTVLKANTDIQLSTTGISTGIYHAIATDSLGQLSAVGTNAITVLSSTNPNKEYAVSDMGALVADLKAGLYDMYILTTSGGDYDIPAFADLSRSASIIGKPGLAEKPVIGYSAGANTYDGIFRVRNATEDVVLTIENIEFDCSGDKAHVVRADSKTDLILRNCYIHDNVNSNGVFRLGAEGSSVKIENSLITDCYRRIVHVYGTTGVYGDITLTNNTFSNISSEGVVYYRSSGGNYASGGNITINHCTFSEIGGNIFRYSKPLITGSVSVTNSIFSEINDSLNVDILDYNYLDVEKLPVDAGTNSFTTQPVFADSANNNFGLTNHASYVCGDGETVGDLTWYQTPASIIAIQYPQISTNLVGDVILTQANISAGTIYLVREGESISTIAELNAAVEANKGDSASISAAFTEVGIPVEGLYSGSYHAIAVGTNESISAPSQYTSTILDWLNIQYEEQLITNGVGKEIPVVTSVDGVAYIVAEGDYSSVDDLESAVSGNRGAKTDAVGEAITNVSVEGLRVGTYYGYAVSGSDISLRGENSITINTSIYVDNKLQTATNKDDAWGHAYVTAGTVGGYVYLLSDDVEFTALTEEILEEAVENNLAAKDTIAVADSNFKVATKDLTPGSYHFYMVKDGQISESSSSAVTVREPKVYYFSAEESEQMRSAFYNSSITTGDEVILTTSGGVYNFKTYFRIYGGVYLHAQEGLAEKPVLLYNPASGGEDVRTFMRLIEFYPPGGQLKIEGIEFDGGANDDLSGNSTFGVRVREDASFNYGYSIIFEDCYFHDFNTSNENSSGVQSQDGYVFRQSNNVMADSVVFNNCIVENIYNPAIYFRKTITADYFKSLQITNTTFKEVPSILSVSSPIEDSKSMIEINHCTFDSIGSDTSTSRVIVPDNISYLNLANSIITNSTSQVATDTALVVYGNSSVMNCNFHNSAPIVANGGQVSGITNVDPGYYNRDAFNYALTNASLLTAASDGKQLGDLRWGSTDNLEVGQELRYVNYTTLKLQFSQPVDTVSALVATNYVLSGTVGLTGNPSAVAINSPNSVLVSVEDFSSAIDFKTIEITVSNVTNVMKDTVSETINMATYIMPIAITMAEQMAANEVGQYIEATCGSAGSFVYLVPENVIVRSVTDLDAAVDSGWASVATVSTASVNTEIDVEGFEPGTYYGYAVNADKTEWSARSTNTATIRGLEVDMPLQLGKTNAEGETVIMQSTYSSGIAYLVLDELSITSIDDLEAAVQSNNGAKTDIVSAFTDVTVSIADVNAGRYRAYVTNNDSVSTPSKTSVIIEDAVSVLDMFGNNTVKIYGYGNHTYIEMDDYSQSEVRIYNLNGSLVHKEQIVSNRTEIELEQGLYIVKVRGKGGVSTKKVSIF